MALVSPGVEVTINDQSQYLPAPTNSVPFILLATAQDKKNPNGTGTAVATTAANANKLTLVTSQRDLTTLYGTPFFYSTTNGTTLQGYELNEYGLLAAYSLLGITNRCYVLRADVNLTSLVGQTTRPTGNPPNGTYWLNTSTSTWGIFLFNSTTGAFTQQTPIVITDADQLSGGVPLNSIGNIGQYAVNAIQLMGYPTDSAEQQFFYKTTDNAWVVLGGSAWNLDIPCVQGTNSNPTITAGSTFTISMSGNFTTTITVPTVPNNTVAGVAGVINALGYQGLEATVRSGKLVIYSNQRVTSGNASLILAEGTGALAQLGITAKTYYQPAVQWGTSAQMPLWSASQTTPRPTGSIWMKAGSAGNGLNAVVSVFSTATNSWIAKTVSSQTSDWAACANLDATGGKAILAGTIYGQYAYGGNLSTSPYYLWERIATGATIITSSLTSYSFTSGDLTVQISVPGSSTLSSEYTVSVPTTTDPTAFTAAWQNAGIPNTTATVNTNGSIVLTHTAGGVIILNDFVNGVSNGLVEDAGFVIGTTTGCKYGPTVSTTFNAVPQLSTTGTGTSATFNVQSQYGVYTLVGDGVQGGGTGYALGDQITISGAVLGGLAGANNLTVEVAAQSGGVISAVTIVSGTATQSYTTQLSNWVEFDYTANEGAPSVAPAEDTNWFYSVVNQVDIMVQKNGSWIGYRNTSYDSTGHPAASGSNTTDPNGPIISATRPTTQSSPGKAALAYGDLWIDTSDLEVYPVIYRWQKNVNGTDDWVLIDNTDHVSSNGILFQDARWANSGSVSPVDDPIPTITSLLSSNYLDLDAPSPSLYPQGTLLFNTRRSGNNVKHFKVNYFNSARFPDQSLPAQTSTWLTASGNQTNGAPYMGRFAQRRMVVKSLQTAIDTNTDIRVEDNYFNLLATPNYPELQPNMVVLNADRGDTGYIIGDTPLGLAEDATAIQAWATNKAGATSTGEKGLVTRNTYLGLFYPSGIANDLAGNQVVVPASYMMLRTFLRNDNIAYPWLAAAGTRRGNIDNALSIGYLNRKTDEFIVTKTRMGIRDVLYTNQINPMVFFTGVGLLNYGNKNSYDSTSALDRTNVARLVNYIRRQLTIAARPFVFEPNDSVTRQAVAGVVQTLLVDLVAKRGIYDYLVVCDTSNNTPTRIDRNELWIDVAIEPVKAAEFIYIPVRIANTGELGNQAA
jgi:Phage tail sheath C-terminal domain